MRYPPGHKEKTRTRILEAASKVFRRDGYHASGVDKVMEEAGLTAGGFYAHFNSKQALLAEALEHAGAEIAKRHEAELKNSSGREWVEAFIERYLSKAHLQKIAEGCPLAALISEFSRSDESVKTRVEGMVQDLASQLSSPSQNGEPTFNEEQTLATLALCVGGIGLARSVQSEKLAEQILASCERAAQTILNSNKQASANAKPRRKRKDS